MAESSSAETLRIELPVSPDERAALRSALLAARASELAELRRRGARLSFGYGSESAREGMSDEVVRLRLRVDMLDRLIAALGTGSRDSTDQLDRRSA
jgi:hypothetical protein